MRPIEERIQVNDYVFALDAEQIREVDDENDYESLSESELSRIANQALRVVEVYDNRVAVLPCVDNSDGYPISLYWEELL